MLSVLATYTVSSVLQCFELSFSDTMLSWSSLVSPTEQGLEFLLQYDLPYITSSVDFCILLTDDVSLLVTRYSEYLRATRDPRGSGKVSS
jgi:hypothetical protein